MPAATLEERLELGEGWQETPVRREMDEARQLLQEANGMRERAGELVGDAVRILLDDLGLTMREAAAVLGVSHQRVAQLAARQRPSVA